MLCNGLNFIGFQLVPAIQKQNSLIFLELEDYGSTGAWFMIQKVYFMDIVLEYFSLTVYTQVHQSKPNIYTKENYGPQNHKGRIQQLIAWQRKQRSQNSLQDENLPNYSFKQGHSPQQNLEG